MLPVDFLEYISQYPELSHLAIDLLTPPPVSIRINPYKALPSFQSNEGVPWCGMGYYLPERPKFTLDPALHQGRYYVQDASSQAISVVVSQIAGDQPLTYLDACAAPGGKTTCAISVLPQGSLVVANEYDYKRADILVENVAKWGNPNVIVSRGDTKKMRNLQACFDIVAIDAPCSGEGMMRKDPKAIEQWTPALVDDCARIQRQIIENVWESLRAGGYLIYSTCTFNRIENEENLSWILQHYDASPIKINALESLPGIVKGIETPYPCYRFLPGKIKGEGLFICVLQKNASVSAKGFSLTSKDKISKTKSDKINPLPLQWIKNKDEWQLIENKGSIYAIPRQWETLIKQLQNALDVISPGLNVAETKGRDLIPTQQLALSLLLNQQAFPSYEVTREQAVSYLQRQALSIGAPRGFVLLTYDGFPLGFVKNLGSRANNLYPMAWRIRINP